MTPEPRTRSGSSFEGGRLSQTQHGFICFHDVMLHWVSMDPVSVFNIMSNQCFNSRPVGMSAGLWFLMIRQRSTTV